MTKLQHYTVWYVSLSLVCMYVECWDVVACCHLPATQLTTELSTTLRFATSETIWNNNNNVFSRISIVHLAVRIANTFATLMIYDKALHKCRLTPDGAFICSHTYTSPLPKRKNKTTFSSPSLWIIPSDLTQMENNVKGFLYYWHSLWLHDNWVLLPSFENNVPKPRILCSA